MSATIAWFNPFAGIAGDMALGALVDAGADPAAIEDACRTLGYGGWTWHHAVVDRGGLRGTHVRIDADAQAHHRRAGAIVARIEAAPLPDRARRRAADTFRLLAEVEGRLHGVAPHDVHFHEVGAIDSIVDIVGTAVGLELLGIDEVASGPVALGVGSIEAAHGVLPNPPPAVVRLLEGIPVRGLDVAMELTTPTGAALVAALATRFGAVPAMTVTATGFGAGTRNPPGRPNVLQLVVGAAPRPTTAAGDPSADEPADGRIEEVVRLETTVDDVSAEIVGHTVQRLLDEGALDVWVTAVTMKKSRPGVVLSVLARPTDAEALRRLVASETGTLGIRIDTVQRWTALRHRVTVDVEGTTVGVKVGPYRRKAEHEDVVAAARHLGLAAHEVARRAEHAAGTGPSGPAGPTGSGDASAQPAEDNFDQSDR